jgi:heterodisulfide reductase subunit D
LEKKGFESPMDGQNEKNKETVPTKTVLQEKISEYLDHCIECHRCMNVCPVTKDTFTIKELNNASEVGTIVPSKIKQFAFHCVQCGKCVPVCPVHIRRDHMVRFIKFKIRDQKPWGYKRYLFVKGPNLTGIKRITQLLYIVLKKLTNKDLACNMEIAPVQKTEVLFYPGCYIYSTQTVRQTLRLLNHLGRSFSVLGGVTACCGVPHMLQGEFDEADHCSKLLYQKIKAVDPKIIITACAECFEAVEHIKKSYTMECEVLSVVQYLLRYPDKFPSKKIRGKIIVHDSCRFDKQSAQGSSAFHAASLFGELAQLPMNQPLSCCYQWNHGSDPDNAMRQNNYLQSVKVRAPTLACNCLTCYEELKKNYTDVEIIDILQLFEESLETIQSTEQKQ